MTYSEKLKDPRWQKRRLEILDRDKFTCQSCGSTDKTLHVHHISYVNGLNPWDYSSHLLVTLCFECHEIEENMKKSKFDWLDDLLYKELNLICSEYFWAIEIKKDRLNIFRDTIKFLQSCQKD